MSQFINSPAHWSRADFSLWRVWRASAGLGLLIGCLVMLPGCDQDKGPVCYPVRGSVLLDGKPLAEARVLFHPLEAAPKGTPQPLAHTDKEGNFELTTLKPRDGAPEGSYAITVELRDLRQDGDELIRDGRNLLPARYANPKTSALEFKVNKGTNEIPPLEIRGK